MTLLSGLAIGCVFSCLAGTGMHWANFVYKFAPWDDLGCWKDDTRDRALPRLLANFRRSIDWFNIGSTGALNY